MVDWRTDDRELLARILTAEAGNQGPMGMTAAGNVIMNRANTSGYGNGVRGVIMKPGQFSPMNSVTGYAKGEQGRDIDAIRPNETAYTIADSLLSGTAKDITGGATHFYNPDISNPSWAKGKEFKRIGDHVFGSADAGREIASDTMQTLGLLTPKAESKPMMQEEKPRGLLGSLGIQKMEEGAAGETGQRFYERDSFKDTAVTLAQGFGRMGIMGMEEIADDIAKQRTENKARNKTIEYLRKSGRDDLADAVGSGALGARDAAGILFSQPKDNRTALMKNYEYARQTGYEGSFNDFLKSGGGGGSVVNVGQKGIDEFDKLDAQRLADVSETGMAANRSLAQIDRLESLLGNVETGAAGAIKSMAGSFGIKTEGLDDIQAAEALINTLVPQQRQPGSGPMSDADLALFKQSLPRIINTPQGNQLILQTMRGVAQYDAMGGDIVQQYRSGKITRDQAFAALQNRPDPFAQFRSTVGAPQQSQMNRSDALKALEGE